MLLQTVAMWLQGRQLQPRRDIISSHMDTKEGEMVPSRFSTDEATVTRVHSDLIMVDITVLLTYSAILSFAFQLYLVTFRILIQI